MEQVSVGVLIGIADSLDKMPRRRDALGDHEGCEVVVMKDETVRLVAAALRRVVKREGFQA